MSCTPLTHKSLNIVAKMDTLRQSLAWALAYLGAMRKLAPLPAIVLDIDGTVVKNYEHGVSKCVLGFEELVETCVGSGITVFVVTARPDEPHNRKWTERKLADCGLLKYIKHVYMKEPDSDTREAKFEAREKIRAQGYTILLSIGDQFFDLSNQPPPENLDDYEILVGTLGDGGSYAIKLPSEFPRTVSPSP